MFVRTKKRKNGTTSIQIVANVRKGDKVVQKTYRHLGQALYEREIKAMVELAESIIIDLKNSKQPVLPCFSPDEFYSIKKRLREPKKTEEKIIKDDNKLALSGLKEEARIHEGVTDIFGHAYEQLELGSSITHGYKVSECNQILKESVLARIAHPTSKRKTVSIIEKDKNINIPLEKVYRMMDKLHKNESAVKKKLCNSTLSLLDNKIDVCFFDVTTLYFESFNPDELRVSGFSKDNKFKETQVMLALLTTIDGLPIGYEIFPGNTYEGSTLIETISKIEKNYNIANSFLVADRAMFTNYNLEKLDQKNVKFIVAAKLRTTKNTLKDEILKYSAQKLSGDSDLTSWIKEFEYEGRRLIVNYSQKRANKDRKDRQRLIDRLKKKEKNGKILLSDLISNKGTKKYLKIDKRGKKEGVIDVDKIKEDSKWDGIHGVITSQAAKETSPEEILKRYKGLWQIEAAFRVNKHDLKMRPVYHWTPPRIKAHILICFMAYSLTTYVKYKLNQAGLKISFEEMKEELSRRQSSIIRDLKTGKRFTLPSKLTEIQEKIYKTFNIKPEIQAKLLN